MKILPSIGVLALALVVAGEMFAARDSPFPDRGSGYLTFYFDNDLFGGSDQNYTNGLRLSWISEDRDIGSLGIRAAIPAAHVRRCR